MSDDDDEGLPLWIFDLKPLVDYVSLLVDFASSPLRFIRRRLIPVLVGGIFGFVFDLASIISRPFGLIASSLGSAGGALSTGLTAIPDAVGSGIVSLVGLLESATAPLGVFQPFVLAAIAIVVGYAVFEVSIRVARGLVSALPGLSFVDGFLSGGSS